MMTSSVHQLKALSSSQCLVYYIHSVWSTTVLSTTRVWSTTYIQCLVYYIIYTVSGLLLSLVSYKSLVNYKMSGLLHTYNAWSTTVWSATRVWSTTYIQCLVYYSLVSYKMSGLLHTCNAWSTTYAVPGLLHSLVNYIKNMYRAWSATYLQCLVYYICSVWSTTV